MQEQSPVRNVNLPAFDIACNSDKIHACVECKLFPKKSNSHFCEICYGITELNLTDKFYKFNHSVEPTLLAEGSVIKKTIGLRTYTQYTTLNYSQTSPQTVSHVNVHQIESNGRRYTFKFINLSSGLMYAGCYVDYVI